MKTMQISYWVLTILFCLALGSGAVMNLLRVEDQAARIAALNYPPYLMTILGVANACGVIALLIPKFPLLKEWAYAGFTFKLLGASASHGMNGDPLSAMILPLVMLAICAGSYFLRAPSRRVPLSQPREA